MAKGISNKITGSSLTLAEGTEIVGDVASVGRRIGIVVSRFNQELTGQLVSDAVLTLRGSGVSDDLLRVVWVPGAYEIPSVLEKMARTKSFAALLAFGVVIQGETPHADLIGREVAHHIIAIARNHLVPVLDGVVVAGSYELAAARSASGPESRGTYVARAALEMASVFQQLDEA